MEAVDLTQQQVDAIGAVGEAILAEDPHYVFKIFHLLRTQRQRRASVEHANLDTGSQEIHMIWARSWPTNLNIADVW